MRFVGPALWPIDGPLIFTAWWVLPLAVFGWCVAFAESAAKRLLLAAAALVAMPALAYAGGNWSGSWIRYGLQVPVILCLLYFPAVRLTGWLARACVAIAAATYHIYLFGSFAADGLDGLLGWSPPTALRLDCSRRQRHRAGPRTFSGPSAPPPGQSRHTCRRPWRAGATSVR